MFKGTTTKSIAIAVILSVTGVLTAHASANNDQSNQFATNENVSRSDARIIIRDYLKSKEKYKNLRIGQIHKVNDKWKVTLKASNGVNISKVFVDYKTGEITFKR